ncbi:MAG: DUF6252 family protein [Weeksellaceae bacterium]
MKTRNLFYLTFAMLFAIASFSVSCKSDDNGGGGGGAAEGTITAKVDGTSVTTISMTTAAQISNGTLMVMGNDGGQSPNKAIVLTIFGFDNEGTYPIGGGANIYNVASYTETNASNPTNPQVTVWQAPYDDTHVGDINISEVTSTHVKGTFSFKAKSAEGSIKNVTEGAFNVKLQ